MQTVADDHAAASRGVTVGPTPDSFVPLGGDEATAVGPVEVKPVATVADGQVDDLRNTPPRALRVLIAPEDGEEADHEAFVTDRVHVVQLGGDPDGGLGE